MPFKFKVWLKAIGVVTHTTHSLWEIVEARRLLHTYQHWFWGSQPKMYTCFSISIKKKSSLLGLYLQFQIHHDHHVGEYGSTQGGKTIESCRLIIYWNNMMWNEGTQNGNGRGFQSNQDDLLKHNLTTSSFQMVLPTEMKTCANWLRDF